MGSEEILHSELLELASGPIQVFVVKLKKVKPSDDGVYGRDPDLRASILESVDNSRMAATDQNDQTTVCIDHQ
jgi:hypothetical protein